VPTPVARQHHVAAPIPASPSAPPPNVTVARVTQHTLSHPTLPVQYDFVVAGEEVTVVVRDPYRKSYALTLEEARHLWKRLRGKGYWEVR
jgi:hypothetical protein